MWNSHASMSSLNLGELESAESPNKENGSGIAGLRNILFARNFQTKVCYWWVTFIPSSSQFSKLLSRVIPTIKPQVNPQLLPCSVWGFTSFDLSGEAAWLQSTCFFSAATETGEHFVQHSDGKGQSRSKSGFVCCGNTSQGWGSSQGWAGRAAQNSVGSWMALAVRPAQWSALWVPLLWKLQRPCFQTDGDLPSH